MVSQATIPTILCPRGSNCISHQFSKLFYVGWSPTGDTISHACYASVKVSMKEHHTKEKGDLGVAAITFDLQKKGIKVCLPLSEHLPFDLIAVSPQGSLKKVSVKYRHYLSKTGCIEFTLRSCWADKNGTHTNYHDKSDYDCLAFYCPDNDKCYYIKIDEIHGKSICLRVIPSQRKTNSMMAENYQNPQRIFTDSISSSSIISV